VGRAWLRAALAGEDGPGRRALPAGELLHPVPLAALLVLVANDWLVKPRSLLPAWLSGKLSDVAGLVVAPLAITALLDCALWLAARTGLPRLARIDFSLRLGRLHAAAAACAAVFAAVKLWPDAARALERAAGWIGLDWRVVSDPTDLVALPAVGLAVWMGRRAIARVPLGRLEVLERRWRAGGRAPPGPALADVARCGGDPARAEQLASALESYFRGGSAAPARAALDRLRKPPG
jgi:hypothetical protein